ncbi:MAG: C_GCAxxG_C_C family protein [Parasporobacterium sp.]|nr:C_GCAxxG_C_C family protein [Parasporobacterium sp.]
MTKTELADHLHRKKYNCCQSVLCALADKVDIDEQTLFRMGEGFGLGMGNMNGVCGALSAVIILSGIRNSDGNLENPGSKQSTMALVKKLQEEFKEKTGSIICRELKGADTGKMLCSCPDCIRIATEIAEEMLSDRPS